MANSEGNTFESVHERLAEIVDEVSAEDISLDDALKLYEEAVKLGLSACDLSEEDIDTFLAAEQAAEGAAAQVAGQDEGTEAAAAVEATVNVGEQAEQAEATAEAADTAASAAVHAPEQTKDGLTTSIQ